MLTKLTTYPLICKPEDILKALNENLNNYSLLKMEWELLIKLKKMDL